MKMAFAEAFLEDVDGLEMGNNSPGFVCSCAECHLEPFTSPDEDYANYFDYEEYLMEREFYEDVKDFKTDCPWLSKLFRKFAREEFLDDEVRSMVSELLSLDGQDDDSMDIEAGNGDDNVDNEEEKEDDDVSEDEWAWVSGLTGTDIRTLPSDVYPLGCNTLSSTMKTALRVGDTFDIFHAASHKFYSLLNETENMRTYNDKFNVSSCIICSCLVYITNLPNIISFTQHVVSGMHDMGYKFVKLARAGQGTRSYVVERLPWTNDPDQTSNRDRGSLRQTVFLAVKNGTKPNATNPLTSCGRRIVDRVEEYLTSLVDSADRAIDQRNVDRFQAHQSSNPAAANNGYENYTLPNYDNPSNHGLGSPPASRHLPVYAVLLSGRHIFNALAQKEYELLQERSDWSHRDEDALEFLNAALIQDRDAFEPGVIQNGNDPSAHLMRMYQELHVDAPRNDKRYFLGKFTLMLIKYLCQQCRYCTACWLGNAFDLDHLLEWYKKSFNPGRMYSRDTTTHRCPFQPKHGLVNRAIYEALKTAMICRFCHDFNSTRFGTNLQEANRRLEHEEKLKILPLKRNLDSDVEFSSFRELFMYIEFPLLIRDWYMRGAFKQDSAPVVTYTTLGGVLHDLLGIDIRDVCRIQSEEEWLSAKRSTRKAKMLQTVANIAKKLSKNCYGCNKCFVNLGAYRYQGVEVNHRLHLKKVEAISQIRDIVQFCKEVLNCDCDLLCRYCHDRVSQYQRGKERPSWYQFEQTGEPLSNLTR
jgi:hypothetical protein